MARPLFEQYKDALRRGHVALAGEELETALGAYREATGLVPDRPLPYASMGVVLRRLGRDEEALEAYDRAIGLAPSDEALTAARDALVAALALAAASHPSRLAPDVEPEAESAEPSAEPGRGVLRAEPVAGELGAEPGPGEPGAEPGAGPDRGSDTRGSPGAELERSAKAPWAALSAEGAASTQLVTGVDAPVEGTSGPALEPVIDATSEPGPALKRHPERRATAGAAAAAVAVAASEAAAAAAIDMAAIEAMRAALVPEMERPQATPNVAVPPAGAVESAEADPGAVPGEGGAWPAIDLPSPPPAPLVGPPPDAATLQAEAEALIDAGDELAARDLLLLAITVHRDAGRPDAALDAALQVLAIAPGDPRVHLAIANLQLDRGWRPVATEKIELLLRLTSLSGDTQAEANVHLLAAERLRDESPARLDARRRGLPAS